MRREGSEPDPRDPSREPRDDERRVRRERPPRERASRERERTAEESGEPGRTRPERGHAAEDRRSGADRKRTRDGSGRILAMRAARLARHYINEMTGKDPEEVTALVSTEEHGWRVDVQVVETRRIPDSTDILAVYQAELDADGELLSYRRIRRYARCQVQEG